MIKQFFNLQNIITVLACVSVFLIATKFESCQNAKELHRLDKVIADLQEQRTSDSTKIANADAQIFDLQQSLDASKGNDSKHQKNELQLTKERNEARQQLKVCQDAIEHYEQNGLIRYFVKKPLSKWYEEVFEKPKNIK